MRRALKRGTCGPFSVEAGTMLQGADAERRILAHDMSTPLLDIFRDDRKRRGCRPGRPVNVKPPQSEI
jgi:hypothetical protein